MVDDQLYAQRGRGRNKLTAGLSWLGTWSSSGSGRGSGSTANDVGMVKLNGLFCVVLVVVVVRTSSSTVEVDTGSERGDGEGGGVVVASGEGVVKVNVYGAVTVLFSRRVLVERRRCVCHVMHSDDDDDGDEYY